MFIKNNKVHVTHIHVHYATRPRNMWSMHVTMVTLFPQAVHISEASPAWQDYVDYVDAIVLDGLKQACLTSLKSMLNQIVKCNMSQVCKMYFLSY